MFLLPQIRERKMSPYLQEEMKFYQNTQKNNIENYQLQQFNKLWEDIQEHVEFYRHLVDKKEVPKQFETFDQFTELPIVTRNFVNKHIADFTNTMKEADSWGTTGGSTGNPLKFPKWASETEFCEPSILFVRQFFVINRSI